MTENSSNKSDLYIYLLHLIKILKQNYNTLYSKKYKSTTRQYYPSKQRNRVKRTITWIRNKRPRKPFDFESNSLYFCVFTIINLKLKIKIENEIHLHLIKILKNYKKYERKVKRTIANLHLYYQLKVTSPPKNIQNQ